MGPTISYLHDSQSDRASAANASATPPTVAPLGEELPGHVRVTRHGAQSRRAHSISVAVGRAGQSPGFRFAHLPRAEHFWRSIPLIILTALSAGAMPRTISAGASFLHWLA